MDTKSPSAEFKRITMFTQVSLTQWLPTSKNGIQLASKLARAATSFTSKVRRLFIDEPFAQAFTSNKKAFTVPKFNIQLAAKKRSVKSGLKITTVLALVLIAVVATATTYAALTVTQNLSSTGSVAASAGLGIYSDSACHNNLTSIDWGTLTPGANIVRTVYVKNTGLGTSLSMSMTTSNWSPASANGPLTITWNQEGTRLGPGQSVAAVITLAVSPTITDITSFNVQITITGTQ
jgi:hypothetical protein